MNESPYNYAIRNKFCNEQHSNHRGTLQWPGINGIPVRSNTLISIKEEEKDYAVLVGDFHCRHFDLNNPEDRENYIWVRDRIINGWFQHIYTNRMFKDNQPYPIVYLEWVQLYYEWPQDLLNNLGIINEKRT